MGNLIDQPIKMVFVWPVVLWVALLLRYAAEGPMTNSYVS